MLTAAEPIGAQSLSVTQAVTVTAAPLMAAAVANHLIELAITLRQICSFIRTESVGRIGSVKPRQVIQLCSHLHGVIAPCRPGKWAHCLRSAPAPLAENSLPNWCALSA